MNKYPELFNEDMSSMEARTVLYSSVDGKIKEEIEEIKEAYKRILPIIIDKELKAAAEGWFL